MFNILKEVPNEINEVEYLTPKEKELFYITSSKELFFGDSYKDSIEFGIYNNQKELVSYDKITGSLILNKVDYSYEDVDGNIFPDYYYPQNSNFLLNDGKSLLISVEDIVNLKSISADNFYLSISPISDFFSVENPLIIKEISNSRKEIKLIKSFDVEKVYETINVDIFDDGRGILLNSNKEIELKSGIVYNLIIKGDINRISFSETRDGKFNNGVNYNKNIVYQKSKNIIILDTTEGIPTKLFIYDNGKKERGALFSFNLNVNDQTFKLNSEFESLKTDNFLNKRIYKLLERKLNSFSINDLYSSAKRNFKNDIENLKSLLSLNSDDQILGLIRSIYYTERYYDSVTNKYYSQLGIKDFILNYLKFNYEFVNNFDNLNSEVYNINKNSCIKKLKFLNPNVTVSSIQYSLYDSSLNFLVSFFDSFLSRILNQTRNEFTTKFKSPLKNCLNFGEGRFFQILNQKISDQTLLIKLKDPLSEGISSGEYCKISNISVEPFFQKINFIRESTQKTIKLNNPDFSIEINEPSNRSISTKYYSKDDLKLQEKDKIDVNINKKLQTINVDYTNFSNFIVFSSANLRLQIFKKKMISIKLLLDEIAELNKIDPNNSSTNDKLSVYDKIQKNKTEIFNIKNNFDGFESYLYKTNEFNYDPTTKKFLKLESYNYTDIIKYESFPTSEDIDSSDLNAGYISFTQNNNLNTSYLNSLYSIKIYKKDGSFDQTKFFDRTTPTINFTDLSYGEYFIKITDENSLKYQEKSIKVVWSDDIPSTYNDSILFIEKFVNTTESSFVDELDVNSLEYDNNNRDSLVNNSPEYIFENDENDDYLKFLSMIGHHFDNIYLYISNIGIYKRVGETASDGLAGETVKLILKSFGLDVPPNLSGFVENSEIVEKYLSSNENYNKNDLSLDEKTKIIWKRILNNLPIIYKSKGTEECLRYIISIYGVPNNMIIFKEFGGGYENPNIKSSYLVEEKINLLRYIGSSEEYVKINAPLEDCHSIDFKLWLDGSEYDQYQKVAIPLFQSTDSYYQQLISFGVLKVQKNLGCFYLILKSEDGYFFTTTKLTSLFGKEEQLMSVLLRRNEVDSNFETGSSFSNSSVPVKCEICVHTNEHCVDAIDLKHSFYISSSFNSSFSDSSNFIFGTTDLTSSRYIGSEDFTFVYPAYSELILSDESGSGMLVWELNGQDFVEDNISNYIVKPFIGCMDKFILQNTPLSDENLHLKCKNFNSYYQGNPSSSYDDIFFRFNMGIPIDISYSSSYTGSDGNYVGMGWPNANPHYSQYTASLVNFIGDNYYIDTSSCLSQSISIYPHQTKEFDIINEYDTSYIGPSRFNNNKIEKTILNNNINTLSQDRSLTYKSIDRLYKDTNKFGIFISPIHERNKDIMEFIGDYDIIENTSNPNDRFGSEYIKLKQLRDQFYKNNYKSKILFNELLRIYNIYIDKSIFSTLKSFVPSRNKIYCGILIEPTILERNRIENKPVFISEINILDSTVDLKNLTSDVDSSKNIELLTSDVNLGYITDVNRQFYNSSFSGFKSFNDRFNEYETNIFISNGFVEYNNVLYIPYVKTKSIQKSYSDGSNTLKSNYIIELIESGSQFNPPSNFRIANNSDVRNLSKKYIPIRKESGKSIQTEFTTIDVGNIQDRSPIISIPVGTTLKNGTNGITV